MILPMITMPQTMVKHLHNFQSRHCESIEKREDQLKHLIKKRKDRESNRFSAEVRKLVEQYKTV